MTAKTQTKTVKEKKVKLQRPAVDWPEHFYSVIFKNIRDNIDVIEECLLRYKSFEGLDKDSWNRLKSLMDNISRDIPADIPMNQFNTARMSGAKFQETHSLTYYVRSNDHVKYALEHIKTYKGSNGTGEDNGNLPLYQIAVHLLCYITEKEK